MFFNNFQTVIISLIFTTIEDEARLSGLKIQNIFSKAFKKNTFIKFNSSFISSLQADETALLQYRLAIENGIPKTKAFSLTMAKASVEAQDFARSTEITGESLNKFTVNQKMSQLSLIAQNKKLGNVRTLLNEYNLDMKNCGLSQDQFIESVTKSNPVLGKYLSGIESGKATMRGYVGSLVAGKAATIGLQVATMALNTAISFGLSMAISGFISWVSDAINSANELRDSIIDTAKESTDHIKELESSLKSYIELDTTATEADKASALKSVTEQINNKTEALKNATEAEKGYVEAVKESIKTDYSDAAGKAKDAAVAVKEKIAGQWSTDYTKNIEISQNKSDKEVYNEIKDILGDLISYDEKEYMSGGDRLYYHLGRNKNTSLVDTNDIESLLAYYDKLQQAQDTIQQKALELGDSGNALLESPLYKAISEILNNETNKTNIDDYITNRSEEIYNSAISSQGIPETVEQFQKLKETMLQQAGDSTLLADAITNRLNGAFGSLAEEAVKAENSVSILDFTIDTETLDEQIGELQDALSDIADTYQKLNGVIDDYNATGNLTLDNLDTLLSVGDEYIGTLFNENGQLQLNKEAYVALAKAKLEDIRYSMLESAISDINQMSKDDEVAATDSLAESTGNLTEETLKLVVAKKLAEGVDESAIQSRLDTYSQYMAIIDNVEAGLENNIDATLGLENASDTLKDSLENEKKALENSKSALEDKKKALEDTKDGYENAIDSIKSLIDWTENYIKQTKEDEIDALEDKKQSVDDLVESQKELLQAQKDEYNWNKEISDKQNSVAKNALAASIASLDDSSAGKKSYKEAIDTLSESRSDMTDTLYEHSIDTRMEALDKLKEQSDEYYDSEIDKINEFLNDEVALYKAACSMIDNDGGELYGNLLNYCKTYTTTSEAEFNYMWTSAKSAMQEYNIANLDTFSLLNDLQGRIYEVDTAIDTVASGIQSYENKISGVQSRLDNLSDSAQTAINNINAALNAENELNKAKWYYDWQGTRYESNLNQKDSAIQDIIRKIENQNGGRFPASAASIYGTIKHYAKGTRNAKGGVSQVNENGLETLMKQTPQGDFVVLNQGDQVFTKEQTDNLQEISRKPAKYIYDNVDLDALAKKGYTPLTDEEISNLGLWANYSDVLGNLNSRIEIPNLSKKVLENISKNSELGDNINQNIRQNISTTINNQIHGDVTPQMLRLLEKKEKEIIKKSADHIMDIALRNRKII